MLVDCVARWSTELTEEGLLAGLLLHQLLAGGTARPAAAAAGDARRTARCGERAEAAIDAFLRRRPALYQVEPGFLSDSTTRCSTSSTPTSDRAAYLGPDGRMKLRPNNTFAYEPYEPEYGKYGGPAGVELAEWHFRHSSDLVLDAVSSMNLHLRTVLLGHLGPADDGDGGLLPARPEEAGRLPGALLRVLAPGVPRHRLHRLRRVRACLREDGTLARGPVRPAPAGRRRAATCRGCPAFLARLGRALPASCANGWPSSPATANWPSASWDGPAREDSGQQRTDPEDAAPLVTVTHLPAVLPRCCRRTCT